jgi:hypothetical protein
LEFLLFGREPAHVSHRLATRFNLLADRLHARQQRRLLRLESLPNRLGVEVLWIARGEQLGFQRFEPGQLGVR